MLGGAAAVNDLVQMDEVDVPKVSLSLLIMTACWASVIPLFPYCPAQDRNRVLMFLVILVYTWVRKIFESTVLKSVVVPSVALPAGHGFLLQC